MFTLHVHVFAGFFLVRELYTLPFLQCLWFCTFFITRKNDNRADPFFLLHELLRIRDLDHTASSYQTSQSSKELPNTRQLRMHAYALTFSLLSKLPYLNKKGTDWLCVCHLLFLNSVHDWFGFLCCYYYFYHKEIFSPPPTPFYSFLTQMTFLMQI